jgi:GAF domain-containing protein
MSSDTMLSGRYDRIRTQLEELFDKYGETAGLEARLATAVAVLHHKMPHYFWTGVYWLRGEDLVIGPYQGPLACAVLERDRGVCWAAVKRGEPILVPDVHEFPGHIACDARSKSELVVPIRDARSYEVVGVLDVDSDQVDAFSEADREGLSSILESVARGPRART